MAMSILLLVSSVVATCGTESIGFSPCVNNPSFSCNSCGKRPCVDTLGKCWSCAGNNGQCFMYDCGNTCSKTPCHGNTSQCGTNGCGTRNTQNITGYTCTDCGCTPCMDVNRRCWSCAGSDQKCYRFHCGYHCSNFPCLSAKEVPAVEAYSEATHGLFAPPPEEDEESTENKIPVADFHENRMFDPAMNGLQSVEAVPTGNIVE